MISFDENEEYLCVKLASKKYLILSCMDVLTLGNKENFEGAGDCDISVYALNLGVTSEFKARNILCSAMNLAINNEACLNVSGDKGFSQIASGPGSEDGKDGENGAAGGNIYFYVGQTAYVENEQKNEKDVVLEKGIMPVLKLTADGGDGGNGQSGPQCRKGGKGGDGGDGGHIYAMLMNPLADVMKQFGFRLEQQDPYGIEKELHSVEEAMQTAVVPILKRCVKERPKEDSYESWVELINQLCTEQYSNQTAWEEKRWRDFLWDFVIQANGWGKQQSVICSRKYYHAVSGIPGLAGDGIHHGAPGKRGKAGTVKGMVCTSWREMSEVSQYPALHPQLCQMILQKANALFMTGNQKDALQSSELYRFLIRALEGMDQGSVPECYEKWGSQEGMENVAAVFKRVRNSALLRQNRLEMGKDYYGNSNLMVPRLSFSSHLEGLDRLLNSYEKTEKAWLSYREKGIKQEDMRSFVLQSGKEAGYSIIHTKEEKERILENMENLSHKIADMQKQIDSEKVGVLSCLQQCEEALQEAGGYTVDDFVSTLSILGFAPQSKMVMAGQAMNFFNQSSNMLASYDGTKLNKKYILDKAYVCNGNWMGLKEGVKRMPDGMVTLEDPGANMLLAEKEDILALLESFYEKISYAKLKEKIESFCSLVLDRNQAVMEYNDYLVKVLECDIKILEEEENQKLGQENLLKNYAPTLPFIACAMRRRYQLTQENLLEEMYHADKALQYWSLSGESIVTAELSGLSREAWTYAVMNDVVMKMGNARLRIMERKSQPDQEFKQDGAIIWEFERDDLDFFWDQLKENGAFEVELPPADAHTRRKDNPFSGLSEVRISKIRPLIRGLKTKRDELSVDIIHLGRETFYNSQNVRLEFEHNMVKQTLRYREKAGAIHILEDVNLAMVEDGIGYALMSPFARWRIVLPEAPNEIVWKKCVRSKFQFCLEFCGKNSHF